MDRLNTREMVLPPVATWRQMQADTLEVLKNFDSVAARSYVQGAKDNSTEATKGGFEDQIGATLANLKVRNAERFAPVERPTIVSAIRAEQEFEGVVLQVLERSFVARLHDLTNLQNPEEEVEIDFDEVTSDDRALIKLGALFSWVIGLRERDKQIQRISDIRFRRIFEWPENTFDAAEKRARELILDLTGAPPYEISDGGGANGDKPGPI